MGARQRTHQPTIWQNSGCWPLVWAAEAGQLWCIWAPSQALPINHHPGYLLRYTGRQWPSWYISWNLVWKILDVPPCGRIMLPAPLLVASACPQILLEIYYCYPGSCFSLLWLLGNPPAPLLGSLPQLTEDLLDYGNKVSCWGICVPFPLWYSDICRCPI